MSHEGVSTDTAADVSIEVLQFLLKAMMGMDNKTVKSEGCIEDE